MNPASRLLYGGAMVTITRHRWKQARPAGDRRCVAAVSAPGPISSCEQQSGERSRLVAETSSGRLVREGLLAGAVVDDDVGWLTRSGDLVPDEHLLCEEPTTKGGR